MKYELGCELGCGLKGGSTGPLMPSMTVVFLPPPIIPTDPTDPTDPTIFQVRRNEELLLTGGYDGYCDPTSPTNLTAITAPTTS